MLLSALLFIVGAIIITVPVLISAKLFNAENDGFVYCLLAAIISSFAFQLSSALVGGLIGLITGCVVVALIYQRILKLSFMNGVWASLIAFGIQFMLANSLNIQLAKLVSAYA